MPVKNMMIRLGPAIPNSIDYTDVLVIYHLSSIIFLPCQAQAKTNSFKIMEIKFSNLEISSGKITASECLGVSNMLYQTRLKE